MYTPLVARLSDDFEIVFKDNKIMAREEASDLVEKCQSEARAMLAEGASTDAAMDAIQVLSLCVESNIAKTLERANEEIAFQASVRKDVASHLENYTCADETLDTTEDLETRVWDHHDGVKRTVHVKHERPASRIHVIENFISEEECKAMEESASKTLHRATVADGKGGSQMSDNRKAMQAGIKVQWDKEHDEEGMEMHIAQLSRRVYDYTNHVLGLGKSTTFCLASACDNGNNLIQVLVCFLVHELQISRKMDKKISCRFSTLDED